MDEICPSLNVALKQYSEFPSYMTLRLVSHLSFLLLFSFSSNVWAGRTALVIGNSHYIDAPLKNPVNDAQDMAAALRLLDFQVHEYLNVNRKEMRKAIREFGEELKKDKGVGLFYYAGHGIQIDGENYLLPLGANIEDAEDVFDEGVDISYALNKMEESSNQLNVIILDACRNNPFQQEFRSLNRGLTRLKGPKGSFISFATSPGDVAADGSGRNGVFTQHVLDHLMDPNASLETVFKNVRRTVDLSTGGKQLPWDNSSVKGTFHFFDKKKWDVKPSIDEEVLWDAVRDSDIIDDFEAFLAIYPNSPYTIPARFKIEVLNRHKGRIVYGQAGNNESKLSEILLDAQSLLIKHSLSDKNLGDVYLLYKDAESIAPDNIKVIELRTTLIDAYTTLAKYTIDDGDIVKSEKIAEMIAALDSENSSLKELNAMHEEYIEGKNVSLPGF